MKGMRKRKGNSLLAKITIFILTFFTVIIITSVVFRFSTRSENLPGEYSISYVRVEVLNGCGVNDLAYKISLFLREKGYDVVEISDVKGGNVERTIVIERVDKSMKNAKILGKVINCQRITAMIDSTLFLEVTLLLGKDYKKYFSKKVLERNIY
jgi:hypothetical protein